MPDIGTGASVGIPIVGDLLGGLFGGNDESTSGSTSKSGTSTTWDKFSKSTDYSKTEGGNATSFENMLYSPYYSDAEKQTLLASAMGKFNKAFEAGKKDTAGDLASKGLTGGILKSQITGNNRDRNEALSSLLGGLETEATKKLLTGKTGYRQFVGSSTGKEATTGSEEKTTNTLGYGTEDSTKSPGWYGNSLLDQGLTSIAGSGMNKFTDWLFS